MLRTNLSTRPFYNERAVYLFLLAAALAVVAVSVFNSRQLLTLSARSTTLAATATRDEVAARDLALKAESIRRGVDRREMDRVAEATREANDLIDQRTFSWTEFFNVIETTLPSDVMLTSVRPRIHEGVAEVTVSVVARSTEDIDTFMAALEETGVFADLLPRQEEIGDDGLHRAVLSGRYLGTRETARRRGQEAQNGS